MQTALLKIGLLMSCLLWFAVLPLSAQPNKVVYLVNDVTKLPVPAALIKHLETGFSTIADDNGYFNLKGFTPSAQTLVVTCIGYHLKKIATTELQFINNEAIIYLEPKVSSLSEVMLSASSNGGIFKTISDLDIHLRPIINSQEVLRIVPGLFIGQHAGGGKAEQIFLRGFDIDHGTDINITVDGMPVNMVSHAHGQGYADLHFVIPELVDKVNFNKGPYFAQKGNFTTAGFVEFRTNNYLENNFVKAEGGHFGTFRGIAGINLLNIKGNPRSHSLYFAGEGSFTRGYFDSPQDFSRVNGILKYHGRISSNTNLTASISGFSSNWKASGQIPERSVENGTIGFYGAIDNTEGGKTSRYNANLELLTNMPNGSSIHTQFYYTRYLFELYSNFTFYKEDPVNGDQVRQKESRNIMGYNGTYKKEFMLGNVKTESIAGIQLRLDDVNDIELTGTKNRITNTRQIMLGHVHELNAGSFWEQRFSLTNKLDITPAVRADLFTNCYNDKLTPAILRTGSSIISPKLNLFYKANKNIQLYLYNGKGFHSNDTRVAVAQNGKKVLPPAYGTDLGIIFKPGKRLVLQSALWYLWLDQEFVYVGDEGVVEPGGQTRRYGLDLSARYELVNNLFADVDISLAKARTLAVPVRESYLPLSPAFTSIGGLTYRKASGWNGSLRYRYMHDRPANENNSVEAKGYFIADAAINYLTKKWEAGIAIQNLFNTKWKETQFDTESRLKNEPDPVSEIHFTPGTPFFARLSLTWLF